MNEKICYKKLDKDDILEILIEYFQENEFLEFSFAEGYLLGDSEKDLRFIGVFSNNYKKISEGDIKKIDREMDYNGDHSFLKNHPEYNIIP
ncbi:hypothetical protein P261_00780 [Lachnospiraceae bacterium TWA4]|nr:hypothetical protein P261_00780 [Lachnospiraceae bacterium TWA4]